MRQTKSRHSSLFLLELAAAIFFFCLASAVCVRFFVKSHTLSQDTKNLDMAVNRSSSFAEMFRSNADFYDILETRYPDGEMSDNKTQFIIFYDENWTLCRKENESFRLIIQTERKEQFCTASFSTIDVQEEKEIYTLEAGRFMREEADDS